MDAPVIGTGIQGNHAFGNGGDVPIFDNDIYFLTIDFQQMKRIRSDCLFNRRFTLTFLFNRRHTQIFADAS